MPKSGITLLELHTAYAQLVDPPAAILHMQRPEEGEDLPDSLDILFLQPLESDNLSEEERFTLLATAGVSNRTRSGKYPLVELLLTVNGPYNVDDLQPLGMGLAALAMTPFRGGTSFAPNLVLHGVSLPLFENMTGVLFTDGAIEWLPNLREPVRVLSVVPLYESETAIVEEIGGTEAMRRFYAEGTDPHSPERQPARLAAGGEQAEASPTGGETRMSDRDVAAAMREVWDDIEAWYKEKAPRLYGDLKVGASEKELKKAEKQLGLALPADYRASLKIHNGEVYLHDYNYLNLEGAVRKWSLMAGLSKEGKFEGREVEGASDGKIQDTWWHEGWIPFAEDGGGNLFCIDMAPGEKGKKGQVIQMELGSGPFSTEYESFLQYMEHYRDALKRGAYEIDSDGMLSEA